MRETIFVRITPPAMDGPGRQETITMNGYSLDQHRDAGKLLKNVHDGVLQFRIALAETYPFQ